MSDNQPQGTPAAAAPLSEEEESDLRQRWPDVVGTGSAALVSGVALGNFELLFATLDASRADHQATRERLRLVEADAGVMREALVLIRAAYHTRYEHHDRVMYGIADSTLNSTAAGAALLVEFEALRLFKRASEELAKYETRVHGPRLPDKMPEYGELEALRAGNASMREALGKTSSGEEQRLRAENEALREIVGRVAEEQPGNHFWDGLIDDAKWALEKHEQDTHT